MFSLTFLQKNKIYIGLGFFFIFSLWHMTFRSVFKSLKMWFPIIVTNFYFNSMRSEHILYVISLILNLIRLHFMAQNVAHLGGCSMWVWDKCVICCCLKNVLWMSIKFIWFMRMFSSTIFLLIFYLLVLSITVRGVFKYLKYKSGIYFSH